MAAGTEAADTEVERLPSGVVAPCAAERTTVAGLLPFVAAGQLWDVGTTEASGMGTLAGIMEAGYWAYGAGSCWRNSPVGYVWVCGASTAGAYYGGGYRGGAVVRGGAVALEGVR